MKIIPTQEVLQTIFGYNQITGNLIRLQSNKEITTMHHTGYTVCTVNKKTYNAQHIIAKLILNMEIELTTVIDHINGIKNDNRLSNLRFLTYSENNWNTYMCNKQCEHIAKHKDRIKESYFVSIRAVPEAFHNEMTKNKNGNKFYSKYMSYDECVELRDRIKAAFIEHLSKIETFQDIYNRLNLGPV